MPLSRTKYPSADRASSDAYGCSMLDSNNKDARLASLPGYFFLFVEIIPQHGYVQTEKKILVLEEMFQG
jgi:hypothetical protein